MGLLRTNGLDFEAVADVVGGRWLARPEAGVSAVQGASIDTRSLRPGEIFFALQGDNADGHDYLDSAARSGCPLAVIDRAVADPADTAPMGLLLVENARAALGRLARAYRSSLPGLRVIGITGSNGKTTTVRLLHAALSGSLQGSCSMRSFNNDLGLPLTLLKARPEDEYVICEMGTNAPGEMAALVKIAQPDIGIITSIGRSHLEALGSIAGVAEEKAELVRSIGPGGFAAVCADSPELDAALEGRTSCTVRRVGCNSGADVPVTGVEQCGSGIVFSVFGERVRVMMPGSHNAINAALAMQVARWLGVCAGTAADGICSAEPPPMRLERIEVSTAAGPIHLVNDAYNANPDSMHAAVGMLVSGELDPRSGAGRRVAVLGEMLELGDESIRAHDELARSLVRDDPPLDGVVLIGTHAVRMASIISESRPGAVWLAEPRADSNWGQQVSSKLRPGDVVLLKGSRGLKLERLVVDLRTIHSNGSANLL